MLTHTKMSLLFGLVLSFQLYGIVEVGQQDGGEFCYKPSGTFGCGMSPAMLAKMMQAMQSAGLKSGSDLIVDFNPEHQAFTPFQGVMNVEMIRAQFPVFVQKVHGYPLIYFDSASTAQVPQVVIDAMVDYYQNYKSNVGRGLYQFAEKATEKFEIARAKVARFIGAKNNEIVFTSGATASINLVAHIWAQHHIGQGDEIVVSEVEHNANFIPWQQLAHKKNATLKRVPVNSQGVVTVEELKKHLTGKTKLVAITHQSNILGTVNDIAALAQAAREVGARVLVDAAQSVAHHRIDVEALGCDFLAFSGHKLFGPTGVGVLYLKQSVFDECVLHNFGGGMVYGVTPEEIQFKCLPHCLEPGTQAIAQVIGLGAAIDFIEQNINFEQAAQQETELVRYLAQALQQIADISLISPIPSAGQHNSMVTFTSDKLHPYDIAEYLDQHGIAVRAGYHCSQPYHDKLGGNSSVRVSLTVYNTLQEIDFLIDCLKKMFGVVTQ